MDAQKEYAQVILPVPLAGNFTYIVPESLRGRVCQGSRVLVPFGARHFYTGIVTSVTSVAPPDIVNIKEISDCLDVSPIVRNSQLRFWEWMAEYYLCTTGEVFKAALPAGLKVESETRLEIDPDFSSEAASDCSEVEIEILGILKSEKSLTASAIEKKLGNRRLTKVLAGMLAKKILVVSEKVVERYRVVKRPYVRITIPRGDSAAVDAAFAALKRSQKQENVLVSLIALSEFYRADTPLLEVPLEVLCEKADVTRSIVKALSDKGYCEIYYKEISRFSYTGVTSGALPKLSPAQSKAHDEILRAFNDKDVVLLHGVTASGKTEIYIHLIDFVLKQGKHALFLVPEIALTTQLTRRLQNVFGEKVLIYHSKFTDSERVELWRRMLAAKEPLVAIGARSAVFLPFDRLGLVIVDEEHESSYKQYDPAPRYNGRDAAAMLGHMHGAKVLFGSATPSVETYFKATTGKFGLVSLTERFDNVALPKIEVVNMKYQRAKKAVSGYFSTRLLDATLDAVTHKKQAILFHNRRGYAPVARCSMCAFTAKCNFCDVSLTYHRRTNKLQCHYCGTEYPVPTVCPECKEPAMEIFGYGTERLEEEITSSFRDMRVLRMDLDTTRNKDGYSNIIDKFSNRGADILVGTQMVTKGLDFKDVSLVGILNADSLVNYPDFRSAERAFNMIEQVAGRAGRRDGKGLVLIQTHNPEHPVLQFAANHDYLGFYNRELEERRAFGFPPFTRIINIYLKHRDRQVVAGCAAEFVGNLRKVFGSRVSPPQEPPVARVQLMYIQKIMLKLEQNLSMKKVKEVLRTEYINLVSSPTMKGLSVYYDVDPV